MVSVHLPDVEATEALGAALAHEVARGDVIFLRGELGSGKTSLARGFLRRFFGNRSLDTPSPSYLLHFAYNGDDGSGALSSSAAPAAAAEAGSAGGGSQSAGTSGSGAAAGARFRAGKTSLVPGCPVHHIDPYRLPDGKIASLIDFETIFSEISLVEWPDRLGDQLVTAATPQRLEVAFEGFGPQAEGRTVMLSAVGARWEPVVERWRAEGGPLRSRPSDPSAAAADGASAGASADGDGADATATPGVGAAPTLGAGEAAGTSRHRNCRPLPSDPRDWRVLGIESSCDDTGAAVLSGTGEILGEALASQADIHEQWGGVVPRLAQEGHRKAIDATVEEALRRANIKPEELSAIAVTVGPGLGLCLEVGVRKGLQLAAAHRLPLVRVHHMEAHTLVTRLPQKAAGSTADAAAADAGSGPSEEKVPPVPPPLPAFPFVTLLVSGGHNMAVLSRGIGRHTILGSTIDDSIGEAFDKTARILGITQVPGGPHLERLAKDGDPDAFNLPMPLSKTRDASLQHGCDYSFSGLKTAVRSLVDKELSESKAAAMDEDGKRRVRADVAAAFQDTAVRHLCTRASRAVSWAKEMEPACGALVVAGGVAANQQVRAGLREVAEEADLEMRCPPPRLCVDNGVMVAWAGVERLRLGLFDEPPSSAGAEFDVEIRPRWALGVRDPRSQTPKAPKGQGQKRKRPAGEGGEGGPAASAAKTAATGT